MLNYLKRLGWKRIKTKYCQFVSSKNRIERYIYCRLCIAGFETFYYSIFLDECTVEMVHESKAKWFRQSPDEIKLVGKYQHEASVHILGAISKRGRSKLMIFKGNLRSHGFKQLCSQFLIPFIANRYPIYHSVHMDNARHHVSETTTRFLNRNGINHFRTPAQSPDLNPIELVWQDLKVYLSNEVQPNTVNELVNGILEFLENITVEYCNSKINHLNKVMNRIILLKGKASGL